jgi:hypothetical protein
MLPTFTPWLVKKKIEFEKAIEQFFWQKYFQNLNIGHR